MPRKPQYRARHRTSGCNKEQHRQHLHQRLQAAVPARQTMCLLLPFKLQFPSSAGRVLPPSRPAVRPRRRLRRGAARLPSTPTGGLGMPQTPQPHAAHQPQSSSARRRGWPTRDRPQRLPASQLTTCPPLPSCWCHPGWSPAAWVAALRREAAMLARAAAVPLP